MTEQLCEFCEDPTEKDLVQVAVGFETLWGCPRCCIEYETAPTRCRLCDVELDYNCDDIYFECHADGTLASILCDNCHTQVIFDRAS